MMRTNLSRHLRSWSICFVLLLCVAVPLEFIPSVEASTSSSTARLIKKLKKEIKTLKAQLANALRPTPIPLPFVEMVTVGNRGNLADPADGDSFGAGMQNFGAVPYEFRIGRNETTLMQYIDFLNAVAVTDTYGLYHDNMALDENVAGIERSGTSGSYTYSVIGSGTRPVTYVSWFDAARFCNWLHHGRPTGAQDASTTESGAYLLNGATSGVGFLRQWGAKYWIPSEDE
jgi:formylglycine-generating enzyme required for sulfatase activity